MDLYQLPPEFHADVRKTLSLVAKGLEIVEDDHRKARELTGIDLGTISGIISAVVAVIGLCIQEYRNHNDKKQLAKDDVESAINRIETYLRLKLPDEVKSSQRESMASDERPRVIELEIQAIKYRLSVYDADGVYLVKGRTV